MRSWSIFLALLPLIKAQSSDAPSSTSTIETSASSSYSSSAPSSSASFGISAPIIPFEDQISCRCSAGETNYPQCREDLPLPGTNDDFCSAEADCGPYTPFLGANGAASGLTLKSEEGHPEPFDVTTLSDTELETIKTMELELYTEFLKNDPIYGEEKVVLPYCGLGDYEAIGEPALVKRVSWGSVFGSGRSVGDRLFGSRPQRPYCVPKRLSIPIHFNVFTTNCTSQYNVSDEAIQMQLDDMNKAYAPLYITWTKGIVTRYAGEEYRRFTQNINSKTDTFTENYMMEPRFRRGGVDQLHVFVVESITEENPVKGEETLGYCYYPGQSIDGCLIKFDTMPGVAFQRPDTAGDGTLVHEAGHWLNLAHTHDETAKAKVCGGSDDVADTFQHPFATKFDAQQPICKEGKITADLETVTNYMSYADDKRTFTQGQRARMFSAYYFFRKGIKGPLSCTNVAVTYPAKRTYSTYERLQALRALPQSIKKRSLLGQRPNIINELKAICSVPYSPDDDLAKSIPDAGVDIRVPVDTENLDRPSVQPPRGGGTTTPGGTTPGGTTPGGTIPGGTTPGSTTPGGTTPGGTTPGGTTPGGTTPGGTTPDGTTPGGTTPGGTTPGGNTPGTPGGSTPGGTTPGGSTPGGTTPGGTSPGGSDIGREIYHTTKQGTKCLDVKYDWRYDGSPVQLFECNGTPAQKWIIRKGETKVRLAGTDYCLDAGEHPGNFVSMKLWKCYDGLPQQQWWFTEDNRIAVKDQGQCLDLRDGVFEDWATVQTYKCTDYNTNQIWTVEKKA